MHGSVKLGYFLKKVSFGELQSSCKIGLILIPYGRKFWLFFKIGLLRIGLIIIMLMHCTSHAQCFLGLNLLDRIDLGALS